MESGTVDREGAALDTDQREDGYVLICCATPDTDCRFVAGDQIQQELFDIDFDAL
jgi:ferredoxin